MNGNHSNAPAPLTTDLRCATCDKLWEDHKAVITHDFKHPPVEQIPPGVSAIFISDGRVIAHVSDFNRSRPGGFTLREAQESRVRARLAHAVVCELSSSLLANNVDSYICEQILRKLPGTVHILPVGHGDQ